MGFLSPGGFCFRSLFCGVTLSVWAGDKNISIFHLSCRMKDLQFSLVLETQALVIKSICNKEHKLRE